MTTTVSKEVEFDAGHRVPNHASKCRNPHGHRYRVRATAAGDIVAEAGASSEGMVVDFGDLKALLTDLVHDRFDHGFIVHAADRPMRKALAMLDEPKVIVVPYIPTAENLAADIYRTVGPELADRWGATNVRLTLVEVWETPTSLATYTEVVGPC